MTKKIWLLLTAVIVLLSLNGYAYAQGSYTLAETNAQGENTIIQYEINQNVTYYDPLTGIETADTDRLPDVEYLESTVKEAVPKYYDVTLNKTEYGNPDGETTLSHGWEKVSAERFTQFKENPSSPQGQTIDYKYNPAAFNQVKSNHIDNGTVVNPIKGRGAYRVNSGAGFSNPEGSTASIDNILFLNNKTTTNVLFDKYVTGYIYYGGGAIDNTGNLTSVSGTFINNTIEFTIDDRAHSFLNIVFGGGAIYNAGQIGDITADFVGNYIKSDKLSADGGAIFNDMGGVINSITGNFINNHLETYSSNGAAIHNQGDIGDIKGDFIGNHIDNPSAPGGDGGAIVSTKKLGDITGNFIGNYIIVDTYAEGGAIKNNGDIGNIKGDFIGNYAVSLNKTFDLYMAKGGAISNTYRGKIESITGDFIGNYVSAASGEKGSYENVYYAGGGAIYNESAGETTTIGDIKGNFIKNHAVAVGDRAIGGAIANETRNAYRTGAKASIGNINGSFTDNYVSSKSGEAYGGAVYNMSLNENEHVLIGNITGDFINNYAQSEENYAFGGAVYNNAEWYNSTAVIGDIKGNFIGNYAKSVEQDAKGGAIYNYGTIGDITGDFNRNYAESENYYANGGAIYNNSDIGDITGNFTGNHAVTLGYAANGGAIYNRGYIDDIKGNFTGNYAVAADDAYGGAIYNRGNTGNIQGDFIANYITSDGESFGGAIYNEDDIDNITGNFTGNYAVSTGNDTFGGAIYNEEEIKNISGNFTGNYAESEGDYAYGGAIYNKETIEDITGDFTANHASSEYSYAKGGAIYNKEYTGNVQGNFTGNYAASLNDSSYGGAVYTSDTLMSLNGDFTGNYAFAYDSASGGALYNSGNIGSSGYDVSNENIINLTVYGQTFLNESTGEHFTVYNKISEGQMSYINSELANGKKIVLSIQGYGQNVTNDDWENTKNSYNPDTNYGYSYDNPINLFNSDDMAKYIPGVLNLNFYNNSAKSTDGTASGGALYNTGEIADITGNFKDNYAQGSYAAYGGAIYNSGTIGSYNTASDNLINVYLHTTTYINSETGEKITVYHNTLSAAELLSYKDRIANGARLAVNVDNGISDVPASSWQDFKDNIEYEVQIGTKSYDSPLSGFDEADYAKISGGLLNASFYNNYAKSDTIAFGGAIYTSTDLYITADDGQSVFSGNYIESNGVKTPNAIYVDNNFATLTLNAKNNGTIKFYDQIDGQEGYKLSLKGDNTGAVSLYNDILNANVTTDNVTVDFANNETKDYNFISLTSGENSKFNIDIDLTNKKADTITVQDPSVGIVTINMINYIGEAEDKFKVQILKTPDSNLQLAFGDNIHVVEDILDSLGNTVYNNDVFAQEGGLMLGTTDTANDSVIVQKDKIYDTLQLINQKVTNEERNFTFKTSDSYFVSTDLGETSAGTFSINGLGVDTPSGIDANSHSLFDLKNKTDLRISNVVIENAKGTSGSVINAENAESSVNLSNVSMKNNTSSDKGGAISANTSINISANKGFSVFSGNKSNNESNAIYMNDSSASLNLNAQHEGVIVFDDKIDGTAGYTLNLDGDNKSQIAFNNDVNNANIHLNNTNLYLGKDDALNNSQSLTLNSGTLSLANNSVGVLHTPSLNLNGNVNLAVDVDLAGVKMDTVSADNYTFADGAKLNVSNLNLLSDAKQNITTIYFADSSLADSVQYTGAKTVAYSPIWKYDVSYAKNPESNMGFFTFAVGGGGDSGSYNPSVLATSVATQSGGYTTQTQTFNYAFQHSDNFMAIPYLERFAIKNANKYALSPTGDATDVGVFSPLFTKDEHAGFWVKPYASFESIPLQNGPKVSNINYGTLIGYDSDLKALSHGFDRVLTGYIGYNGASQRYSGVDTYQNGGIVGGTTTFYKGNFFNATTLSVGASAGNSTNMYGSENYSMLLAGIGNKTGYNFEFFKGKVILQPNFLISYTFVNTFDYTNAAGLRIKSDPLNAIQLSPGIKLIGNTKNGWQPYLSVNMVWNLMDDAKVTANDVRLPEMSIKPYVQYGVGVQKRFQDRFTAYLQTMIHNGGRNGVSLSGGLRWQVGKQ